MNQMTMSATTHRQSDSSLQARPRVLVADDSRVIRMAIKKILGADYDLVEVGDGASAWDRVREDTEIKALVTDIEMPNVDGYELICRIRGAEESHLRELPVIAITGADDDATKQRAFACGATDFIVKPIDAIQLQARVQAYVRYDQAAREQSEKSMILEDQAIVDSMTGLCSRRYLSQRGEQDLAFSIRHGNDLGLIRIDIDHFKKLYKTHGDDISEDILAWFAKLLSGCARTEDTVARIGGAQFAVLANGTNIENASVFCQRLQETVANRPYRHKNLTIPVTMSIGMASLSQDRRDNFEELLKLAQQRLCHAQSEGGDRLCSSILSEMHVIEEVLAPPVEPQADGPRPSPEPAVPPVAVDPMLVADLEGIASPEAEFTLDLAGLTDLTVEPTADGSLSVPDPAAEPAAVDTLMVMDLAGIEEPVSQTSVPMASTDPLSVDDALHLLAQGQAELLAPHLDALMQKLQPLIDFIKQVRRSNADQHIDDKY